MKKIFLALFLVLLSGCATSFRQDVKTTLGNIGEAISPSVSHQYEMNNFIFVKDEEIIPFHQALYQCGIPTTPTTTITEVPCAAFKNVMKVKTHAVYQWQQPEGTNWIMNVAIEEATLQAMKEIGAAHLSGRVGELEGRITQLTGVSLDKQGVDILWNHITSLEVEVIPEVIQQKQTSKKSKKGRK